MATIYLPSGGLTPPYWYIRDMGGAPAGDFGLPTVGVGGITFDWSGVPFDFQGGTCGLVDVAGVNWNDPESSDSSAYNIAIPGAGGRVAFTVAIPVIGSRESVSFSWSIGDLVWRIQQGSTTRQMMTSVNTGEGAFVAYPWTGSCSYLLWFPNGADQPARLDFDGGSITMPLGLFGRYSDFGLSFRSGGASTGSRPGGFPLPFPPDPKSAQLTISGIFIESWDPTGGPHPFAYPWAVAVDGEWHGTYNKAASGYFDADLDQLVFDWSYTYPKRLGS
jgi:hypothetical protein